MSTAVRVFTGVVTSVALLASLYLTGLHLKGTGGESVLCDALSATGCSVALHSRFGSIAGVPLALMLVGAYVALLVAWWKERNATSSGIASAACLGTVALVAGGLFLLGVMAQSGSFCPLCLFMDGCNLVLLGVWGHRVLQRGGPALEVRSLLGLGGGALAVILVGGLGKAVLMPAPKEAVAPFGSTVGVAALTVSQCQDVELSALEISDFLCPYCKRLERNLAMVLKDCGARVDKRFVHFPLDQACNRFVSKDLHPGACRLAEASECARLQGAFPSYSSALFERGVTAVEALVALAGELKLDAVEFRRCLSSGQTAGRVRTDIELAHRLGVRSTPTFYLNGRRLEGALGAEQLTREIAAALAKDVQEVKILQGGVLGSDPWSSAEPAEACGVETFSQESAGGCQTAPAETTAGTSFP